MPSRMPIEPDTSPSRTAAAARRFEFRTHGPRWLTVRRIASATMVRRNVGRPGPDVAGAVNAPLDGLLTWLESLENRSI